MNETQKEVDLATKENQNKPEYCIECIERKDDYMKKMITVQESYLIR